MTTLAQLPPLQIVCQALPCKRRQNVPLTDVYAVQVKNRSGGSHKEAGCLCRVCGAEIQIAPSFLRKGVLQMLPTREEYASARTPPEPEVAAPSTHVWGRGADAKSMLETALVRIRSGGGDMIGLTFENGVQDTVEIPLEADAALMALEENACHLLVACGPNADGSTWQVVFHPAAGAATMTSAAE